MKFNLNIRKNNITNHAGSKAWQLTPELELYTAVATTMLSDTHYESGDERLQRVQTLLEQVSPLFVARLAVYARTRLNLRTIPLVLTTGLARMHKGDDLVRRTVRKVIQRPDEIMELLACYQALNGRTGTKKLKGISKQLQKGLADSFNNFDEYQFAKYNRDNEVKLRDALFIVHPKAKDEAQQALFDRIAAQQMAVPLTWETELSALGQQKFECPEDKAAAFRNKWEALIDNGTLGYMALLRNLRNIVEAGVSAEHVGKVCARLADAGAVARSKQLPFRFLAAYRELKSIDTGYRIVLFKALEQALQHAVANIKGMDIQTRVVIACDVSGSMQVPVSAKSKVLLYDIGLLMGMLLQSKCKNVYTGMFGDTWKMVQLPESGILANVDAMYAREGEVGYSTNGYLVIKDLVTRRQVADKVMLFTDMQLWDSQASQGVQGGLYGGNNQDALYGVAGNNLAAQWAEYKKIAPAAQLYLFDLAGHGQAPVRVERNDVYLVAGWSDKVFDIMEALENGADIITEIENCVDV
jgi:hypothetical protein